MTDPKFKIPTDRLELSYFIPSNDSHCEFLVKLYNTPLFIESSGKTSIDSVDKARLRIESFEKSHKEHGFGQYLVSLKDGEMIGSVNLSQGSHYSAPDIGFAILPEHNGKGYATEAAQGLIAYKKITAVFGFCDPKNERSGHVLEKIGLESRGCTHLEAFGGVYGAVYTWPGMGALEKWGVVDSPPAPKQPAELKE
jgi:RimJ/RimL family protein N-acetyltransferase